MALFDDLLITFTCCCCSAECDNLSEEGFDVDKWVGCLTLVAVRVEDDDMGIPCNFAKKEDIEGLGGNERGWQVPEKTPRKKKATGFSKFAAQLENGATQ